MSWPEKENELPRSLLACLILDSVKVFLNGLVQYRIFFGNVEDRNAALASGHRTDEPGPHTAVVACCPGD